MAEVSTKFVELATGIEWEVEAFVQFNGYGEVVDVEITSVCSVDLQLPVNDFCKRLGPEQLGELEAELVDAAEDADYWYEGDRAFDAWRDGQL